MAALDFPDTPIPTQDYRAGDIRWEWRKGRWVFKSDSSAVVPLIDHLEPTAIGLSDQATTLRVVGTSFDTTTQVYLGTYDAASNRPNLRPQQTTYVSASEVTCQVLPSDYAIPSLVYLTVRNGDVNAPPPLSELKIITNPTVTDITPDDTSTDVIAQTFVLTVAGTGFTTDPACPTQLLYDGAVVPHDPTMTPTQITATLPKEPIAKVVEISVKDGTVPATTPPLPLEFIEIPGIASLNPLRINNNVESALIRAAGLFTPDCVLVFNTTEVATSAYVSPGEIDCTLYPLMIPSGAHSFYARNKRGAGYTSEAEPFNIDIVTPILDSISPSSVSCFDNVAVYLYINGQNFTYETKGYLDGVENGGFSGAGQLWGVITGNLLSVGAHQVTVKTKDVAGTGTQTLTVTAPAITSISPTNYNPGQSLALTVDGSGFLPESVVYFSGNAKVTTYVSATRLTAQINTWSMTHDDPVDVRTTKNGISHTSNSINFHTN